MGAGSVYLYIGRVITALRSLGGRYVQWPRGDRLRETKELYCDLGFPNCIGSIDGSLLHLANTPEENSITYYTRKGFYGVSDSVQRLATPILTIQIQINIAVAVDGFGRAIFYDIGWPGSQNDISVFKRSSIWTERHKYFGEGEYILGDKGMLGHRCAHGARY